MNKFNEFQKVSKTEWIEKIQTDLKGKELSVLDINDPVEELTFAGYQHTEDGVNQAFSPGNAPYTRGMNLPNNEWNIGVLIRVEDECITNKKALKSLNEGADLIVFKSSKENIEWKSVLENIQVEFIKVQFVLTDLNDVSILKELLVKNLENIQFNLDFIEKFDRSQLKNCTGFFREKQIPFCSVNGFKVQQSGANTWQEISFCLSKGHEYLVQLMKSGLTIDEASACVSFKIGVGSNYFFETAKVRALKMLWAKIISEYNPEHNCSKNIHITAVVGHMNKSLKDPYTNLLRQTTEAMSAINGGIDALVILPYDDQSITSSSELAERMALNISSILKEESYLNKVIDPLGGSYSIEQITVLIANKAWKSFQELEALGGIFENEAKEFFTTKVNEKRELRIQRVTSGDQTFIGVNKFMNPDEPNSDWKAQESYLGMTPLIIEQAHKSIIA